VPHWLLIGFFSVFVGLALFAAAVGALRFWKAMAARDRTTGEHAPTVGVLAALLATLGSILSHDRFAHCEAQKPRRTAHLAAFYGFLALFVVTVWAVIDLYVMPLLGVEARYPFGLLHPMKVLANVGALLLLFGIVTAIANRALARGGDDPGASVGTPFDGIFLWLVLGVGVTGLAAEIFRFTVEPEPTPALRTLAYGVYFLHLVLVFQLLVYLPYTKFAHVLYRTVAMVYAEHTGRHHPARRTQLTVRGESRPALEAARP
jgi:quinone-modifying oxidoreductase subunit QmoC